MATEFVIMLPSGDEGADAAVEAADLVEQVEADLTVYRPDSEISRVNSTAYSQPVVLSAATFSLLQRAVYWSQQTNGAFDVTAGPLVEAWGFTKRSGRKPTPQEVEESLAQVGYQNLVLEPAERSVRFAKQGMSVNLGGIGKGDALDRMASHLQSRGVSDFLIHGGNSSVIAFGDQQPGSGLGWAIGMAHPTKPDRRLVGLWLRNAAMATSGSGKQFFHHQGRRYGHVIDPRTGYPAGDLLSLTLVMDSATDADALATGLFISGSETVHQRHAEGLYSACILTRAGSQQDAVQIDSLGMIDWIEPPNEQQPPSSHDE